MTVGARFRKRPLEVHAIQFFDNDDTRKAIGEFGARIVWSMGRWTLWTTLSNAWVPIEAGDWIVRGIHGEYYPCAAAVFSDTYEVA